MTKIFVLFLALVDFVRTYRPPISCYHCASLEYKPLFHKFAHLNNNYRSNMNFGNFCDSHHLVQQTAPATSCDYSCVTIFEPQFIGGIMNQNKPYAFVRGCATDIFLTRPRRPAEIDFLHRGEICLSIPLSQIWPDAFSDEIVHVCSCTTSGCNRHDAISTSSSYSRQFLLLIILRFVVKLLQ